jgi:uncharacterized membrane protein
MSELTSEPGARAYLLWIERGAIAIEILAVILIIGFIAVATAIWAYESLSRTGRVQTAYEAYRVTLGRALLIGLEILVAADIVRTVALEATIANILGLALLVLIRTFLSWSIVLEIEGRWPWQTRAARSTVDEI